MPLLETAGLAGAKFLAKKSIAVAAEALGLDVDLSKELVGGVADWFKDKVKEEAARKKLTRPFETLPKTIADKLQPLFQNEIARRKLDARLPDLDSQVVVVQLCLTLEDRASLEFFLAGNLDAAKLTEQLREVRRLERKALSVADTQFYHRALERLVPELIALASKLPAFPAEVARELLNRIDRVGDKVDGVKQLLDAKGDEVEKERSEFETRYRGAVIRKNDKLELFGADVSADAAELPLSVAYVSLNLQSHDGTDGSGMRSAEALFDELCPESGRLLIRGEAGMGKTTLFRWAAIEAAKSDTEFTGFQLMTSVDLEHINFEGAYWKNLSGTWSPKLKMRMGREEATAASLLNVDITNGIDLTREKDVLRSMLWRSRIPFLIRLRDCPEGKIPGPDEFLKLIANHLGEPPKQWVVNVLRSGQAIVLLDGVDEVRGDFRQSHLLDGLTELVKTYPQNYFVVSTRPEAVPTDCLKKLGFREARINPMSENDKRFFIDQWHRAIAQPASVPVDATEAKPLNEDLKDKLVAHPAISRLATNPLMCAMICALHRTRQRQLPESQSELVEVLCEMLLHRRDAESGLKGERFAGPYSDLNYRQKKWIVQDIAHDMLVLKGESVISLAVAEPLVSERLKRLGARPDDAAVVLQSLVERSGMLREATPKTPDSPGTLDFVHNTFKEYLTGTRLAKDGAVKTVVDNAANPDWLPVVLFAVATEESGFATKVLCKILGEDYQPQQKVSRTRTPKGGRRRQLTQAELVQQQRLLLALRCLPVALDLDEDLRNWLKQQMGRMFPPRSMTEAEALATAGDLAVPFLKSHGGVEKKAHSVRALRLIGSEAAKAALRGFLKATSMEVLDELAQAMNPLEIPAIQRMIQEGHNYQIFRKQRMLRQQIRDLSPLIGLTGLTKLDLLCTQVSDLSPLAGLTELKTLNLGNTQVSDLSPLAGLTGLTTLHLHMTPVSDLSPLVRLTSLTTLGLADTQVSDLSPLSGLTGLTMLELVRTEVSDLSPLAGLTGLTMLNLYGMRVSDLSPLAGLTGLTKLNLNGTRVNDLSPLAGLKNFKEINVLSLENLKFPESLAAVIRVI